MRSVSEIRGDIAQLEEKLRTLRTELREAQLQGCPVAVGDRVKYVGDWRHKSGKTFIVARIEPSGDTGVNACVHCHPLKKDGATSKLVQYVGAANEFEKVSA